jgi:sulfopropanediol 3-dehydrogenase
MKVAKSGGHRLFEQDRETAAYAAEMLEDREDNGMDAVRKYSTKFDE